MNGDVRDEDCDMRNEMPADELLADYESLGLHGNDKQIFKALRLVCAPYIEEYNHNLSETDTKLGFELRKIDFDISPTPALRERIVDMIRFGHVDEGLLLRILVRVYANHGLYDELFHVCEDVLNFKGDDRNRLLSGTLVESVIYMTVFRLATIDSRDARDYLASRCLKMLERRASTLCLNVEMYTNESNPLHRISMIAYDVLSRQKFEPAYVLAPWIRTNYPKLYKFLNLTRKNIALMIGKKSDLLYDASAALRYEKHRLPVDKPYFGALGELESMLELVPLDTLEISNTEHYGEWKKDLRQKKLCQSLFEMRLYLHFRNITNAIELEPLIDTPKHADLKVHNLYIEAYSPRVTLPTTYNPALRVNFYDDLIWKILNKPQIKYFGTRQSLLIVEDPFNYVNDSTFHQKLTEAIRLHPQLGGVFIVRANGLCYRSSFVRNLNAQSPIPSFVESLVELALESPYASLVTDANRSS